MADKTLEAVIKLRDEMSKQLKSINKTLEDLEDCAGDASDSVEDLGSSLDGMALMEAGSKMMEFGSAIIDVTKNMMELTEETEEFRTLMSKLEASTTQYGYTMEDTNELLKTTYGYLGDDMASTNVINNLQGMNLSQEELNDSLDAAIGVWTAYGDSIPIEGLTESINESAQVGKVVGTLADALNWAGENEELFNEKLEACNNTQERAKLIVDTLNGLYGDSKKTFDELNESVIEGNKAELDLLQTQADLGEAMQPLNSGINEIKASIGQALLPVITGLVDAITPVIEKVVEWIQANPELVTMITIVVGAITALIGIAGVVITVIGMVSVAMTVLNVSMLPIIVTILAIVVVITALVMAGVWLYKNWDTIKAKASELWQWMLTTWNGIKEAISTAITNAKNAVVNTFDSIKNKVEETVNNIKEWWNDLIGWFSDNPVTAFINKVTGGDDTDGSHAYGLNTVPYNGYTATLHQGERVLTASQARTMDNSTTSSVTVAKVADTVIIREEADIEKIANAFARKLRSAQLTQS